MISFDVLTGDNADEIAEKLCKKHPDLDADYVLDIADQLSSSDDSCEYALSAAAGCLLIRVFEDEYFFLYPEPVAESFDVLRAIDEIRMYSIREEICPVISEVPSENLGETAALFAHSDSIKEDESGESFTVRALSEIASAEQLPEIFGERISLTHLCPSDEKRYAELCRDEETNRFWGYNYREDAPDCADSYFLEISEAEFSRGVAASFAMRLGGELIGEAVLYAFDYLGGAECAVRLLPEYRGKRLAGECVELLCTAAKKLHIRRLYATVDDRNKPSIHLFSRRFSFLDSSDGNTRFLREM